MVKVILDSSNVTLISSLVDIGGNVGFLKGSYVTGSNGRGFAVQQRAGQSQPPGQQQRPIGSPGSAPPVRQQPFSSDGGGFQPPASPNSAFTANQYLRLQRANSAPTATTQLPGKRRRHSVRAHLEAEPAPRRGAHLTFRYSFVIFRSCS